MKKKSKIFLIIAAVMILFISIWIKYPRSSSFNDLILNKCELKKPYEIIAIYKNSKSIDTENITSDKINELLLYLNEFKLIEYKKEIPLGDNNSYEIGISDKDLHNVLAITIKNKNYIDIYISNENTKGLKPSKFSKKYKIINGNLDMNYIENLFN